MADSTIEAFRAGYEIRLARQKQAQEMEDRKLEREMLQHRIRQLGIEEKLQRRKAQLEAAGTMEGRPGPILPGTEGTPGRAVALEGGQPGAPTFQTSPLPGIQPEELPHLPVGLEAIPELGVPGQTIRPRNLSERLKELALEKQIENVVSVPGMGEVDVRAIPAISAHLNQLAAQRRFEETEAGRQRRHQETLTQPAKPPALLPPDVEAQQIRLRKAGASQVTNEINELRADLLRMQMAGTMTGEQRLKAIFNLRELATKRATNFDDLEAFGKPIDQIMEQESQRIYGKSVAELRGGAQGQPKAIPTGKPAATAGQKISVISPQGVKGTIPSEDFQEALKQGYRLAK